MAEHHLRPCPGVQEQRWAGSRRHGKRGKEDALLSCLRLLCARKAWSQRPDCAFFELELARVHVSGGMLRKFPRDPDGEARPKRNLSSFASGPDLGNYLYLSTNAL